jgi:hypothetical protein
MLVVRLLTVCASQLTAPALRGRLSFSAGVPVRGVGLRRRGRGRFYSTRSQASSIEEVQP